MSAGERRLAAIMFTDMVGYTALTQSNEPLAMEVLERHNRILRPFFPQFRGREVKTIGDSFLVEFGSTLDAIRCAVEIQTHLHDYNLSSKDDWKIRLRIGIHLGDVIHQRGDMLGDAVNIASRIEPVANPEGVCVSDQVYSQVRSKTSLRFLKLAPTDLKNVRFPIDIYKIVMPWEQSTASEKTTFPANRIAILPFASFSPDRDDAYFADGITDEIISTVSGISGLSVISRTSVMGYKGSVKKVGEIGTELEVGSVLEGSVKKSGNRIRVTAQLINVAGDKHLWAQNYDRNLDDVFAVQTDVAKRVAEALRVRILSPEMARIDKKPTQNTTAYTLYLKGKYLWNKRGFENHKKALSLFEHAMTEDPSYAPNYLGAANCYINLRGFDVNLDINLEKAKANLARALELDPNLAEAHATNALLLMDDYYLRDAEEKFRKAIELNPSYAFAHMWYHLLLVHELRWDEAADQIDKANELDPFSMTIIFNYAFYYVYRRDYRKALELTKRIVELDPSYPTTHIVMA